MEEIAINWGQINRYVDDLLHMREEEASHEILSRLEREGQTERIPIMQPAGMALLRMLVQWTKPKRILEIGTAIGYSTLHLALASPEAEVITLELDEERAARARRNFEEAGVQDRVHCIVGDAVKTIAGLKGPFDGVFIDAAKGKYPAFLELSLPLLRTGGWIASDNVLFRGYAAMDDQEIPDSRRSMIRKLKQYNELLATHPLLETLLVPIGDGVAVSRKRQNGSEGNETKT